MHNLSKTLERLSNRKTQEPLKSGVQVWLDIEFVASVKTIVRPSASSAK